VPLTLTDKAGVVDGRVSRRELLVAICLAVLLAIVFTWPFVLELGRVARTDQADGQFSIWNVAWVARTLVVDPLHVFDANIFYPHRGTLAYSENNLGAGLLAIPAYWLTRNPYAAHNVVVLIAFVLSQIGMYLLARHLTGNRAAAAVAAVCYAFCPFVVVWTAEIQLLMIFGLPFVLLACHRLADAPSPRRGAALGLAMAVQTWFCGYYGVFTIVMTAYALAILATTRSLWRSTAFWRGLAIGACVAVLAVAPIFAPYLRLQRVTGFTRPLNDAIRYSADWRAYLASAAYAHRWLLRLLPRFNGVLFPGVVATVFGAIGAWSCRRSRNTEPLLIYGGLALLAAWASFGPSAGLYSALYRVLPVFAWLRAPGRFGLIVVFGLAVLAAFGVDASFRGTRRWMAAVTIAAIAFVELVPQFRWVPAPAVAPVYRTLASLPRGPVIETPFYYPEVGLFQHTKYMLASTSHWFPLVNGYSDYTPPDFLDNVMVLAAFPSAYAFRVLKPLGVRYAVLHMYGYNTQNRSDVLARLAQYSTFLRPIYVTDDTRLYEIVGYPDDESARNGSVALAGNVDGGAR